MFGFILHQFRDDLGVIPERNPKIVQIIILVILIFIVVAFLIVCIRTFVECPSYTKTNRIDGKVVVITGCNTGIGKETALELAKRGGKIYMACRDYGRCEIARLEMIKRSNNQNIFNRTLDLSSLESVKNFTEKFLREESRLDILINNAGIMGCPKSYTNDGFELQFGVNHLGHFLLTNILLERIKLSAPSRIVVVTSIMYMFGNINKNDILSEKQYCKSGAYAQSKLANILFTKYLANKLHGSGVTVNCCHPGLVRTEIRRYRFNKWTKILFYPISRVFLKTPVAGAQTSIRLALDPGLVNVTGKYFCDMHCCGTLPKARNPDMMEWLWQKSQELIDSKIKVKY